MALYDIYHFYTHIRCLFNRISSSNLTLALGKHYFVTPSGIKTSQCDKVTTHADMGQITFILVWWWKDMRDVAIKKVALKIKKNTLKWCVWSQIYNCIVNNLRSQSLIHWFLCDFHKAEHFFSFLSFLDWFVIPWVTAFSGDVEKLFNPIRAFVVTEECLPVCGRRLQSGWDWHHTALGVFSSDI